MTCEARALPRRRLRRVGERVRVEDCATRVHHALSSDTLLATGLVRQLSVVCQVAGTASVKHSKALLTVAASYELT